MSKSFKMVSNLEFCGQEVPIIFEVKSKNHICLRLPKMLDDIEKYVFDFKLMKGTDGHLFLKINGPDKDSFYESPVVTKKVKKE